MKSSHPVNCRKHPLNSKSGSLCFRVNNGGGGGGLAALPTPNDQQAGLSPSVCLSVGLSHDTREHAYLLGVRIFSDHCPHTGIGQPTRPGLHVWVSISDGRRLPSHPDLLLWGFPGGRAVGTAPCLSDWPLCTSSPGQWMLYPFPGVSLICVRLQAASPQEVTSPGAGCEDPGTVRVKEVGFAGTILTVKYGESLFGKQKMKRWE